MLNVYSECECVVVTGLENTDTIPVIIGLHHDISLKCENNAVSRGGVMTVIMFSIQCVGVVGRWEVPSSVLHAVQCPDHQEQGCMAPSAIMQRRSFLNGQKSLKWLKFMDASCSSHSG